MKNSSQKIKGQMNIGLSARESSGLEKRVKRALEGIESATEQRWTKQVPKEIATEFRRVIAADDIDLHAVKAAAEKLLEWIKEQYPDYASDCEDILDEFELCDLDDPDGYFDPEYDPFADEDDEDYEGSDDDSTNTDYCNDIIEEIYQLCDDLGIWIGTEGMFDSSEDTAEEEIMRDERESEDKQPKEAVACEAAENAKLGEIINDEMIERDMMDENGFEMLFLQNENYEGIDPEKVEAHKSSIRELFEFGQEYYAVYNESLVFEFLRSIDQDSSKYERSGIKLQLQGNAYELWYKTPEGIIVVYNHDHFDYAAMWVPIGYKPAEECVSAAPVGASNPIPSPVVKKSSTEDVVDDSQKLPSPKKTSRITRL